jgi:hypothetical protein
MRLLFCVFVYVAVKGPAKAPVGKLSSLLLLWFLKDDEKGFRPPELILFGERIFELKY